MTRVAGGEIVLTPSGVYLLGFGVELKFEGSSPQKTWRNGDTAPRYNSALFNSLLKFANCPCFFVISEHAPRAELY